MNPKIPNISQKILSAGDKNEVVARILLTAKCLFDERNATVSAFVGALFEQSIALTRHVFELQEMVANLRDRIIKEEERLQGREYSPNAFSLPSMPSLDRDVHNIVVKADKARDSILSLYRLYFLPNAKKIQLSDYDPAIRNKLSAEPEIASGWEETKKLLDLIRNIRNASEHRKTGNQLRVRDFQMLPNGNIHAPFVEVEHKDTPISPVKVVDFVNFIADQILNHAEGSIVTIKCTSLLDDNPSNEEVGFLPARNRRHPFVRYCRAIKFNGEMHILS